MYEHGYVSAGPGNHPPAFWRFLRWLAFRNAQKHFGCRFPSVRKALVRLGPRPILLIHGERDGFIPVSQSQLLFDLAGSILNRIA